MKKHNIEHKKINTKGITLITLTITVVVLIIIAAVSISVGTETLDNTRLQGFYSQLKIIQKRVDEIAITNENYVDETTGEIIYIKEQGIAYANMTSTQQNIIQNEISQLNLDYTLFKYFTIEQLETILGLSDMEYNVFIEFNSRTIIAEDGITIDGTTYRLLNSTVYFVNQNTSKNEGTISSLAFEITTYGKQYYGNTLNGIISDFSSEDKYKIVVSPSNVIGDLQPGGTLKYKKTSSKYWETSTNLEMIIDELTQYNVIYEDNYKNSISVKIQVELNGNNPTVTII